LLVSATSFNEQVPLQVCPSKPDVRVRCTSRRRSAGTRQCQANEDNYWNTT